MPRQARMDKVGTLHHIMLRGIEKKRIFDDDLDRQGFVTGKQVQRIIAKSCKEKGTPIQELQGGSRRGSVLISLEIGAGIGSVFGGD